MKYRTLFKIVDGKPVLEKEDKNQVEYPILFWSNPEKEERWKRWDGSQFWYTVEIDWPDE